MAVPLENGDTNLIVEVDPSEIPRELTLASSRAHEVAAKATETLEQILDKIRPSLYSIGRWARVAAHAEPTTAGSQPHSHAPDECCVEFGLKLGGETGVIVAKGKTEANFVIKLTWKNNRDGTPT